MVLLVLSVPLLVAVVALADRHRRRRRRWVSPYTDFRAAGARVTRTGRTPFRVAGVQGLHPERSPTA